MVERTLIERGGDIGLFSNGPTVEHSTWLDPDTGWYCDTFGREACGTSVLLIRGQGVTKQDAIERHDSAMYELRVEWLEWLYS